MPSFHNARIAAILDDMHVLYQEEVTVPQLRGLGNRPLRFDFYLPPTCYQPELYLEVQDWRHYGSLFGRGFDYPHQSAEIASLKSTFVNMHDIRKQLWCQQHGVALVQLPASLTDVTARAFLQDVLDFFLSARERTQMAENDPAYMRSVEALPEPFVTGSLTHFQRTLAMFGIHPPRQIHVPAPARKRGKPLKRVPDPDVPDSKWTQVRKKHQPRTPKPPPIRIDLNAVFSSTDSGDEDIQDGDSLQQGHSEQP